MYYTLNAYCSFLRPLLIDYCVFFLNFVFFFDATFSGKERSIRLINTIYVLNVDMTE